MTPQDRAARWLEPKPFHTPADLASLTEAFAACEREALERAAAKCMDERAMHQTRGDHQRADACAWAAKEIRSLAAGAAR